MKDCWNCKYQSIGGINLFGKCTYFVRFAKEPQEIPVEVIDVGCKHFQQRAESNKNKKPVGRLLNLFEGEIIK